VRRDAALQEGVELVSDELRQASAIGLLGLGDEGLGLLLYQAVQRGQIGAVALVLRQGVCRRPTVPCTRAARMRQRDARQNTPRIAASVTASLSLATTPSACWCCAGWPLTLLAHADKLPAAPYPARRIRL